MVYDILVYLHTNFSKVMVGFICVIAGLCFILMWRRFRAESTTSKAGRKDAEAGVSEGTLKQLLKEIQNTPQATQKPVTLETLSEKERTRLERELQKKMAAAGDASTEEGAELLKQLGQREAELAKLQGKIKELQAKQDADPSAVAGAFTSTAEMEALQEKIQELEARLKEYEIIEDDIADLSTYKEENARLREQLEGIQGDEASPESSVSAEAPSGESAKSVAEAPSSVAPEPAEQPSPEEPSTSEVPPEEFKDDKVPEAPHVDAEQLLSEVDELLTLGEEVSSDSSGLEEDLNTDKLMQEAAQMPGGQSGR